MQESCPACGGSTSVGRIRLLGAVEKSRSRATGASNTTSLGAVQLGRCRSVVRPHQRIQSPINSGGVAPRLAAAVHQSDKPWTVAAQEVMPPASAISSNDGGHVADMRLLSMTRRFTPARLRMQISRRQLIALADLLTFC